MRILVHATLLIGLITVTPSAAQNSVGRVFTTTTDFEDGDFFNIEDAGGTLKIAVAPPSLFPYVNMACTGRSTVARIFVGTADQPESILPYVVEPTEDPRPYRVGEYRTAPDGMGTSPSRTTVDRRGNVWVANRAEASLLNGVPMGSITRIALVEGGVRCNADGDLDPIGDYLKPPFTYASVGDAQDPDAWQLLDTKPPFGLLKTSRGRGHVLPWPNTGGVDTDGGVDTAEDELILNYTRVAGTNARTMAIDFSNDLWCGGLGNKTYQKVSGATDGPGAGGPIASTTFTTQCDTLDGAYGGLIDHWGMLWSVERYRWPVSGQPSHPGCLVRYDPVSGSPVSQPATRTGYHLALATVRREYAGCRSMAAAQGMNLPVTRSVPLPSAHVRQ